MTVLRKSFIAENQLKHLQLAKPGDYTCNSLDTNDMAIFQQLFAVRFESQVKTVLVAQAPDVEMIFEGLIVVLHSESLGTGTTSTVTVGWTGAGGAKTFTSATWALNSNTLSGQVNGCLVFFSAASQAITVGTASGTYGTSTYRLDATVEELR